MFLFEGDHELNKFLASRGLLSAFRCIPKVIDLRERRRTFLVGLNTPVWDNSLLEGTPKSHAVRALKLDSKDEKATSRIVGCGSGDCRAVKPRNLVGLPGCDGESRSCGYRYMSSDRSVTSKDYVNACADRFLGARQDTLIAGVFSAAWQTDAASDSQPHAGRYFRSMRDIAKKPIDIA